MVSRSAVRSGVRFASIVPLTAALLLFASPVLADHTEASLVPAGTGECEGFDAGFKLDRNPDEGTHTYTTEDGATFSVTLTREGRSVSFSDASETVGQIQVKGGSEESGGGTTVVDFDPPVTAGGPFTPPGDQNAISHVTFCLEEFPPAPELTVTKSETDADDIVEPGDSVSFTITATNSGTGDATGVTITDDLDDGLTITSATVSNDGGAAADCALGAGSTVSCAVGTLAAGTSAVATIAVDVTATACRTIENTSTVDSDQTDALDSNTVTLTVACESILSITKVENDDDDTLAVGQDVTFTLTASNTGDLDATGVVISDNLDDDLTILSATFSNDGGAATGCTVGDGNAVSCAVGTLAAGTSAVATIVADVQADACGPIQNTSSVDSDQTGAQNSNTVNLTVFCEGTQAGAGGPSGGQASGGVPNTATSGVNALPAIALSILLVVMLGYLAFLRLAEVPSRRR